MSTVVGKTSIKIDQLINDTVVSGYIDNATGHLMLTTRGGAVLDGGSVTKPFGAAWSSTTAYTSGDVVGYAGMMWKAKATNTNKPPALFTSLWTLLFGEDSAAWVQKDPFFDGDDATECWQFFWKTGNPVVSLSQIAGEFETGIQALKISLATGEAQRLYQKVENITRGGETIVMTVRARLLSAATGAKLQGIIMQNDASGKPEPFETGSTSALANEGDQTLTTSFATYTFTFNVANAKPRASVQLVANSPSASAVVLIDRVQIKRMQINPNVLFKATRQGGSAIAAGPISFAGVSFNEGNASWDGTVYTIPYSGYYELQAQFKNTSATPFATNLGFQKSTDGGSTWTQIALSPNNSANAFGGTLVEMKDYFPAGTKLRVNCTGGTITPQSDAPAENFYFTVQMVSGTGVQLDGYKTSPNILNNVGLVGSLANVATLTVTIQEQSKIKVRGYVTCYTSAVGLKTITATVNGVTTTIGHLYFNETASHKDVPVEGVLGPLPAGTYTIQFAITGTSMIIDANDVYNFTVEELLTGGWSAPSLTDSGRIYVGAAGAAPFVGGWVNYDNTGATWERCFYHKIGKQTMIGGMIYNATTAYAAGQVMFTLPAGFRPPEDLHVGVQNGANAVCRINIMRNGDVKTNFSSVATAAGSSGWWTLAGICFPNAI